MFCTSQMMSVLLYEMFNNFPDWHNHLTCTSLSLYEITPNLFSLLTFAVLCQQVQEVRNNVSLDIIHHLYNLMYPRVQTCVYTHGGCINMGSEYCWYTLYFGTYTCICDHTFLSIAKATPQPRFKTWWFWYSCSELIKILGIIFDRKLSFIPYIKYNWAKCTKAIQILGGCSHRLGSW